MDRIFEATPMNGYGHPLRVSVFVGVVEYVDDDVVKPNALPQSISYSASADRSSCCCCCKCGWYCWRWRSKAACRRLYKYVMVCSCSLRNVWMCCCSIFITTSSRSMHSCSWCICVVGHSLDMSTDWPIDDEDTDFMVYDELSYLFITINATKYCQLFRAYLHIIIDSQIVNHPRRGLGGLRPHLGCPDWNVRFR